VRAAFMAGPGDVRLGDFGVQCPGEREVLVEMHHAAVCGSDVHHVFDGFQVEEMLGRPGYPGHEGVGVVVESRAPGFAPGDPVLTVPAGTAGGCFAEYQVVDDLHLVPLRPGTDLRRAVQAQQLGTTVFALKRFLPLAGEVRHAAVIGAGSAGTYFLQQLLAAGAEVVVSDLDPRRLATAAALGATRTVLAPQESVVDAVLDLTGGAGADLVVEAAGYDVCREQAVQAVRPHGVAGFFGYAERLGNSPFPVQLAFLKSVSCLWICGTQAEPGLASFRQAVDWIEAGTISVEHCLGATYPLEEVPAALAVAREHGHGAAKITVDLPAATR
jgi:L-iditol 2-dehydrogenase